MGMMQQNAIATPEQLAIEDVKRLANIVLGLRNDVFKEGLDYGKIPGTGDKPTLLKPGMEKLCKALHLRPEYVEKSKIEDFDKPLIYYRYECRLVDYDTGICVSTALGSANSYEGKWRWREQKRTCPVCGKSAIIKGKEEFGGGWLCFKKQEGCGAKFKDGDKTIEEQAVGRVENPDIFDQMNTIDKMAQKRSLGSAILCAANVSELFTVDLEDFKQYDTSNVVEGAFTVVEVHPPPPPPNAPPAPAGGAATRPLASTEPTGDTPQGASGDGFAKDFPASGKWTAGELYEALHDFFNAPAHFERHMDKHAAEYTGLTFEEAKALVRTLHWNWDKATCDKLATFGKNTLGMTNNEILAALAEANGHSVKGWKDWDGGNFTIAQGALLAWSGGYDFQSITNSGLNMGLAEGVINAAQDIGEQYRSKHADKAVTR